MATVLDIQNAVVTLIAGAGITGITSATVKPRKVSQRLPGDGPLVCIVTLDGESHTRRTNMTVRFSYPIFVAIVRKGAQPVARSDEFMEEARSTLYTTLYKPYLLGTSGVVRYCDYASDPPFDRGKFDENDDVSVQLFTYHTEE